MGFFFSVSLSKQIDVHKEQLHDRSGRRTSNSSWCRLASRRRRRRLTSVSVSGENSSSSSSPSSSVVEGGILVAAERDGRDERCLFAAVEAVRALEWARECPVEALAYDCGEDISPPEGRRREDEEEDDDDVERSGRSKTVAFSRRERRREEGRSQDTYWSCFGSDAGDALGVATDPTDGLLRQRGINLALAVVGINRDAGFLSLDDRTVDVARRAAINGVPTVCVSIPTSTSCEGANLDLAVEALKDVLGKLFENGVLKKAATAGGVRLKRAANSPRQHFPFPSKGRWSNLGTGALRADFMQQYSQGGSLSGGLDFALADCWSLGDDISLSSSSSATVEREVEDRSVLVQSLREAFEEGDAFIVIRAPAGEGRVKRYEATRPGVLWRQNPVTLRKPSGEKTLAVPGDPPRDPFGRSLPVHHVGEATPSSKGARFVRQLQTERLVGEIRGTTSAAAEKEEEEGVSGSSSSSSNIDEYVFELSSGTILHDRCSRGDADAVLNRNVSISTVQTWPSMHCFSLTDQVMVESLREDEESGLPAWLCENKE